MGIIAPPTMAKEKKQTKVDNNFLKNALTSKMREVLSTEDGRQMNIAQALADRLVNIALFAESNTDAIAASKLIFERVHGKAAVEKVDETREMPKVIFALQETGIEKINQAARANLPLDDDSPPKCLVKSDEGEFLL